MSIPVKNSMDTNRYIQTDRPVQTAHFRTYSNLYACIEIELISIPSNCHRNVFKESSFRWNWGTEIAFYLFVKIFIISA